MPLHRKVHCGARFCQVRRNYYLVWPLPVRRVFALQTPDAGASVEILRFAQDDITKFRSMRLGMRGNLTPNPFPRGKGNNRTQGASARSGFPQGWVPVAVRWSL